eukprot:268908_1
MGNQHSKELWKMYSIEIGVETTLFMSLYGYLIKQTFKRQLTPKQCLYFTTNVGSTINALISTALSIFFFIDKRWEQPTVGPGKITAHLWCMMTSYFISDALLFIAFYCKYSSATVPRRWLILLHQLISLSPMFLLGIPDPIYCWNPLSILPLTELSTIFLNMQWFFKHYKQKNYQSIAEKAFFVTWFIVRIPVLIYCDYWLIKYWNQSFSKAPFALAAYLSFTMIILSLLQYIWTFIIVKRIYSLFCVRQRAREHSDTSIQSSRKPNKVHLHGISLEYEITENAPFVSHPDLYE